MEPNNKISFEEITEKNAKEITEIYNYYVENTTASYATEKVSVEEFLDYYKIEDEKTVSKAVTLNGELVGFCLLRPWNLKKQAYRFTYEFTIYLKNDFCNKGLFKTIYKEMEKCVKEKDIKVLMAVICGENTASYKAFESAGFLRCGHLKNVGVKFGRFLDLYYYQKTYL